MQVKNLSGFSNKELVLQSPSSNPDNAATGWRSRSDKESLMNGRKC